MADHVRLPMKITLGARIVHLCFSTKYTRIALWFVLRTRDILTGRNKRQHHV
jgi:hypothetical protein